MRIPILLFSVFCMKSIWKAVYANVGSSHPLQCQIKANSHIPFRAHAVFLRVEIVLSIWFTQCDGAWFIFTMPSPCRSESDFSRPRHSTAWHVWINIGCRKAACERPAQVRFLPATTRSSTKVVNQKAAGFWNVFKSSDDDGDSGLYGI